MPLLLHLLMALAISAKPPADRPFVAIVVGAPGTPEYASEFRTWADQWKAAPSKGGADSATIGTDNPTEPPDRDRLHTLITERATNSTEPLWIVLIGHGTFDGKEAKYNLRGPDISDQDLASWLA